MVFHVPRGSLHSPAESSACGLHAPSAAPLEVRAPHVPASSSLSSNHLAASQHATSALHPSKAPKLVSNRVIGFWSSTWFTRIGQPGQAIPIGRIWSTHSTGLDSVHIIHGQPYSMIHGLWPNLGPCNRPNLAYKAFIQVQAQQFLARLPPSTTNNQLPPSST